MLSTHYTDDPLPHAPLQLCMQLHVLGKHLLTRDITSIHLYATEAIN